jgi:hypothetical protein
VSDSLLPPSLDSLRPQRSEVLENIMRIVDRLEPGTTLTIEAHPPGSTEMFTLTFRPQGEGEQ